MKSRASKIPRNIKRFQDQSNQKNLKKKHFSQFNLFLKKCNLEAVFVDDECLLNFFKLCEITTKD